MTKMHKSTRYALYAAMELARASPGELVTAAHVAARYRIPPSVVAKVFQQLVHRGIATGSRGSGGGYRLAAPAADVRVLDVVEAIEPAAHGSHCLLDDLGPGSCHLGDGCRLRRLVQEVDELARSTYASVTLEALVG
jgi:Rrf2 family protein